MFNSGNNTDKQEMMKSLFTPSPMNDSLPDTVLWATFKKGDKDAFTTIYHRYFKLLVQNCFRISADKDFIEDCVHDLFTEMWKNKQNLGFPQSVKAYLISSIQRKVIRQLKKTRLVSQLKEIDELNGLQVDYSAERKIIAEQTRAEQQNTLFKAMNALTKRQKEAVYLKFYANLSYPEIAGKMAISTDSIYNLVSKAIDNMQEELEKFSCQKYSYL